MGARFAATLVVLALGLAAPAAAQPLALVVDAPAAAVDEGALRAALAEETGRTVLGLHEDASATCRSTLVVSRQGEGRWILRLSHAGEVAQRTARAPRRTALARLVEASSALLRGFDAATAPGADLVDPFALPLWDPLRAALGDELHRSFGEEPLSYIDVVDPFRPIDRGAALVDPWTW